MKIKKTVLGKSEATRQYAERFKSRGDKQRPKVHTSDYEQDWANFGWRQTTAATPDINYKQKPNHAARAQSIEDVFAGFRPKKSKDSKGIRVVGKHGTCGRSLVAWEPYIEPEDFTANRHWKTEYHPFAYPCIVDHGWAQHRTDKRTLGGLVRATGRKGEHRDSLGREW